MSDSAFLGVIAPDMGAIALLEDDAIVMSIEMRPRSHIELHCVNEIVTIVRRGMITDVETLKAG